VGPERIRLSVNNQNRSIERDIAYIIPCGKPTDLGGYIRKTTSFTRRRRVTKMERIHSMSVTEANKSINVIRPTTTAVVHETYFRRTRYLFAPKLNGK